MQKFQYFLCCVIYNSLVIEISSYLNRSYRYEFGTQSFCFNISIIFLCDLWYLVESRMFSQHKLDIIVNYFLKLLFQFGSTFVVVKIETYYFKSSSNYLKIHIINVSLLPLISRRLFIAKKFSILISIF